MIEYLCGIGLIILLFMCYKMYFYTQKKVIISIEGNIGVGKTSMINLLKDKFSDTAEIIYEPIDQWLNIKDDNGIDIVKIFYDDKDRWSYTFQSVTYITRMMQIIDKITKSNKKYIIVDRSLKADSNVFAQMLRDDGLLNTIEWNAYQSWNKFFEKYYSHLIEHKILYLRCDPNIAFQRMQLRNRKAENAVPLEYLQSLHKYHEAWLLDNNDTFIVDANVDFVNNKERFEDIYKQIRNFI